MRLGLGLGVKNSTFVGGYDASAQAFLTATGITGKTESDAINALVINLKAYGLWSKMKAIYPIVSDTKNLFSYSEDISNGAWNKYLVTVSANTTTAPDGTLTADSIVDNATNDVHAFYSGGSLSTASSNTVSLYAKANTLGWIRIYFYDGTNAFGTYFDVANGVVGDNAVGNTASITSAGNGWYRCVVSRNMALDAGFKSIGVNVTYANSVVSYAGTGKSLYVWGAQLEAGTSATTYQPIATTPANRFVSQFKYNLKDPRDLDVAFRLAFNGTWTYSKQGALPNGVNGWADTYLNQSANLNASSVHLSYYSRTNTIVNAFDLAGNSGSPNYYGAQLACYYTGLGAISHLNSYPTESALSTTYTDTQAYYIGSRTNNTTNKIIRNGSVLATNSTTRTAALPSTSVKFAFDGISVYSNRQVAFSTIGDGLTDTEATNLYTSVQQFNQDLSRQVGVPIVSDSDAQAFLNSAQITDLTQANAINTLVVGLKNASLWTKMKAIYPFVGGTATSHKWNLKDPRDLDAAYRLAFFGAWTHSSTGALPNGTNAYADTKCDPSTILTANNISLSIYSRTNSDGVYCDMGASTQGSSSAYQYTIYSRLSNVTYADLGSQTSGRITYANTDSRGHFISTRTSSTSFKAFLNSTLKATLTTAQTQPILSRNVYLSANFESPSVTQYSNRQLAFAHIADGLTDSEVSTFYNLVQNMQTSLSRQV